MAFIETPRFPEIIALGSSGGPEYNTSVVVVNNANEYRKQRWSFPRHKYNVGIGAKISTDIDELRQFHHAMLGRLNGFRFKDFNDYNSSDRDTAITNTDIVIGTGDGATLAYQLVKMYTRGTETLTRNIKKPVSGTTIVAIAGIGVSRWTVDTATGIITFSADVARTVTNAVDMGGGITRITISASGLQTGDVWVHSFTGDWAGLNNTRFTLTDTDWQDPSPYWYEVAFDSSSYAAYSSNAGLTNSTPQSGESITAGFEFDVPVRFESDNLMVQHISPGVESATIGIMEIIT